MAEQENRAMETGENPEKAQESGAKGGEKLLTQAEVDALIDKRLAREKRDAEKKLQEARAAGEKAGEARARMTEEERTRADRERAAKEAGERESALERREAELRRRELKIDALDILAKKGLPRELGELLDYSGEEACQASIDTMDKVFRAAVQAGIDERIRRSGGTVSAGGGQKPDTSKMTDAEYYASLGKK